MPFSRDERLGWLTFCPTNLGSTVRASVHIKLPKLTANKKEFEVCFKHWKGSWILLFEMFTESETLLGYV